MIGNLIAQVNIHAGFCREWQERAAQGPPVHFSEKKFVTVYVTKVPQNEKMVDFPTYTVTNFFRAVLVDLPLCPGFAYLNWPNGSIGHLASRHHLEPPRTTIKALAGSPRPDLGGTMRKHERATYAHLAILIFVIIVGCSILKMPETASPIAVRSSAAL